MDVSLVLTHRCNLDCGYCYAGEHHRAVMAPEIIDRAVELMFADGADAVQLSFFGGEPFLAFASMQRAAARARTVARERGATLILQCTTNGSVLRDEHVAFVAETGMRCTVSIDGVREAHDLNRPCSGGGSSFAQVHAGLRRLIQGGCRPDALMVISPETVPYVFRSVCFLWDEGVRRVRANLVVDAPWTVADRQELREHLVAVGAELVARRQRGQAAVFVPFEAGMRKERERLRWRTARGLPAHAAGACGHAPHVRPQLVVATTGNLYPCAPMVGEDRDGGPEAELRLGHLDDGAPAIARMVRRRGAGCGDGKGCACAAYLETGDRDTPGANGLWFADACAQVGAAVVRALAERPGGPAGIGRRPLLLGLAAAGAAMASPAFLQLGDAPRSPGEIAPHPPAPIPPAPTPIIVAPDELIDGEMWIEPDPEPRVKGEMVAEPELRPPGELAAPAEPAPAPTARELVRGNLR